MKARPILMNGDMVRAPGRGRGRRQGDRAMSETTKPQSLPLALLLVGLFLGGSLFSIWAEQNQGTELAGTCTEVEQQ